MTTIEGIKNEVVPLLSGCDVCGEDHETQACPLLQNAVSVEDAEAPSRARLTLPSNLRIKVLKDGTVTIVAREKIPHGTRFGPFEAPVIFDSPPTTCNFLLKIFESDGSSYYLDSKNEQECNWMCYVLPAERKGQQNLMAYQVQRDIYFSAVSDIRIHEELRVWYAMHYGRKIGILPSWPLGDVEDLEQPAKPPTVAETKKRGRPVVQAPSPPPMKRGRKKKVYEEYIETHDYESMDELMDELVGEGTRQVHNIDPKRLGFSEQREWRCSQCQEIYQNCIDFARHLREHYHPKKFNSRRKRRCGQVRPKNFDCQFCSVKFSSAKLLQRHRLRLHRRQLRSLKKSAAAASKVTENETVDTDALLEHPSMGFSGKMEVIDISTQLSGKKPSHMSDTDAATILLEIEAKCDKPDDQVENLDLTDGEVIINVTDIGNDNVTQLIPVLIVEGDLPITEASIVNATSATFKLSAASVHHTDAEVMASENVVDSSVSGIENVGTTEDEEVFNAEICRVQDAGEKEQDSDEQQQTNDNEYVCDICKKSFEKSVYLFRHIRKHTGDFACVDCHKVFARKESLVKHVCNVQEIYDKDNGKKEYMCQYCHKSFGTKHLLRRHVAKHTGEFTCGKCAKSYCSSEILKDHVCSANKTKPEIYPCEICHKTFSKLKYLEKHIPVHTGTHACDICGKWLRSHDSLINHVRICGQVNELEVNGSAICPHCKQDFSDLSAFRRHMYEHTHLFVCEHCNARFRNKVSLSLHVCDAEQSLPCEICKEVFLNVASLNKHRLEHGDPRIKCKTCELSFEKQDELLKHECEGKASAKRGKKKRPSLQPLICEVCGSLFSSTSSLNVHKRLHGEKLYSCDECGKRFHRKDLLIDHCAVHGEAAVPCSQCDKMFKTKKSLDVHLLIHDGVKRFSCATCGKQFHQKGNLIKHEEVHNPDRKYECHFCQKGFSTKEYLAIHILEHTTGRTHVCDICNKSFVKEHQLRAHQRIFHTSVAYICKFCGLSVKLKHSLRRHLGKKHANESHLWSNPSFVDAMLVQSEQAIDAETESESAEIMDRLLHSEDGGTEVLLAVAGIGSEELQQALASGAARIQQGSSPNIIEISLPIEQALEDAILSHADEDGEDKLQAHIIQLPISNGMENCEMIGVDQGDEAEAEVEEEIDEAQLQIAVRSAIESQLTVMGDVDAGQQLHLQEDEMTDTNMIVLENGAILQRGTSQDGSEVFFYVMNPDETEQLATEQSLTTIEEI